MIDLNKAVKDWLITCPHIKQNDFFFQFLKVDDDTSGFTTVSNDLLEEDILGVKTYLYAFSIIAFKSANPDIVSLNNENFKDFEQVKDIARWINEQEKIKNYPDFGTDQIKEITSPLDPLLSGIDTTDSISNPLMKYMLLINIEYERSL